MNPAPSREQLAHFKAPSTSGERGPTDPRQDDLRRLARTELSALFTEETSRRDNEWRRTLESIKAALAGLDRTCEAASSKLTEDPSAPAAAVSDLVEKLGAAAASDSEAAVQRTRAEAQIEIRRLEDLGARLQAESEAERDRLRTAREEIDAERGARARAEAASQKAQDICKQIDATFKAQLQAVQVELEVERAQSSQLKQQIDAGKAERAKLVDALQTVRRAVSFAESVAPPLEPTLRPGSQQPSEDREPAGEAHSRPERTEIESNAGAADTTRTAEATPAANRALKLVSETPAHPDLVAYADQLLGDIEVMYWADLGSNQSPADVVDRLVANLRYAHTAVARRCGSATSGATALFESQMMMLMDAKSETSFARHLGIAAYEYATSHDSPTQLGAETS